MTVSVKTTTRERELEARHRYWAAVLAATESLRRTERRFHELSVSIDAHIRGARAALGVHSTQARTPSRPVF